MEGLRHFQGQWSFDYFGWIADDEEEGLEVKQIIKNLYPLLKQFATNLMFIGHRDSADTPHTNGAKVHIHFSYAFFKIRLSVEVSNTYLA